MQRVETERLVVREFVLGDEVELFQNYHGCEQSSAFLISSTHPSPEHTRGLWLRNSLAFTADSDGLFMRVIALKEPQVNIGCFVFIVKDQQVEIHFGLGTAFSAVGYMTEVCSAMLVQLTAMGFKRIDTHCDTAHFASQRVMEKSGFKRVALEREYMVVPRLGDNKRDFYFYQYP